MSLAFCNVALPVPLRTLFTYAIPSELRGHACPGSRVLVPFRSKCLVGLIVELIASPPEGTKVREITKILDFAPALHPKLIELAQWIAGYYLAPVGEVFRAMLPTTIEIRSRREIVLTEAGSAAVEHQSDAPQAYKLTQNEIDFLTGLNHGKKEQQSSAA